MQCNAIQCNAMQCNRIQCHAMQCNTMQYIEPGARLLPVLATHLYDRGEVHHGGCDRGLWGAQKEQ
eukprot:3747582-Lingulodinium_polyedra.AAC.1